MESNPCNNGHTITLVRCSTYDLEKLIYWYSAEDWLPDDLTINLEKGTTLNTEKVNGERWVEGATINPGR